MLTGKEALIALANGEDVECTITGKNEWTKDVYGIQPYYFLGGGTGQFQFRLKPRTITINGIEVPAPFEPKEGEKFYTIVSDRKIGYDFYNYFDNVYCNILILNSGAWRTEEEIRQVVAAGRSIFK